jgi:hypothetical protein
MSGKDVFEGFFHPDAGSELLSERFLGSYAGRKGNAYISRNLT